MRLNTIDVTITQADLRALVYPRVADKLPVQDFALFLESNTLIVSGKVKNIISLPFKIFFAIEASGAVLTATMQNIDAGGPAAKLIEGTLLNVLETKLERLGAVRRHKSFSIDVNQTLQTYNIDADITFTRLVLEKEKAHLGVSGHVELHKLLMLMNREG